MSNLSVLTSFPSGTPPPLVLRSPAPLPVQGPVAAPSTTMSLPPVLVTAVSSCVTTEAPIVYSVSLAVLPTLVTSSQDIFLATKLNPLVGSMRATRGRALSTMCASSIVSVWPPLSATSGTDLLNRKLWNHFSSGLLSPLGTVTPTATQLSGDCTVSGMAPHDAPAPGGQAVGQRLQPRIVRWLPPRQREGRLS